MHVAGVQYIYSGLLDADGLIILEKQSEGKRYSICMFRPTPFEKKQNGSVRSVHNILLNF